MRGTPVAVRDSEEPGRKLRRVRERLGLKYRDVEEASQSIADLRGSQEFAVGLSRLADIENRGTVPSIFRLYSLSAVYSLRFQTVLLWYGVDLDKLPEDVTRVLHLRTHLVQIDAGQADLELPNLANLPDLKRTSYISRYLKTWGRLPLKLLTSVELRQRRYGLIGLDDWSMFPLIRPGSFVQIDEQKRKPDVGNWSSEAERPIYFVEHRDGFRCGWCVQRAGYLIVQFHPMSGISPELFRSPAEAEIVGQVVAVAMRLDQAKRRHIRS